jgi:hypothetical protein
MVLLVWAFVAERPRWRITGWSWQAPSGGAASAVLSLAAVIYRECVSALDNAIGAHALGGGERSPLLVATVS